MKNEGLRNATLVAGFFVIVLTACKEEVHDPVNKNDDVPGRVENPQVENLPGGAKITYELPGDKGLLYVKAEYEIREGVKREAKSSYYTNQITVDGFGDTLEYEVKLYAVNRNEKTSDPVMVKVNPLTPPIYQVFSTLAVNEDFGGINFSFENPSEADVVIEVITPDSLGDWATAETFYTSRQEAVFSVRGFEPEKRRFGIFVKDRWDNRSDTTVSEVVPLFEEALDKDKFSEMDLPTDYNAPHSGGSQRMSNIWNGVYVGNTDFVTVPGHGLPQWFTFDLGVTAKLSRLVLFKRLSDQYLYNSGAVREWELWGSTDPNPDGSWDDSWTLLKECESFKPSGLPPGQHTNEDYDYAAAGEEFVFPSDAPPVRYIRWRTLRNWGNATHVNITEIDVFGQVQ